MNYLAKIICSSIERCQSFYITSCYQNFPYYRWQHNILVTQHSRYLVYVAILLIYIGSLIQTYSIYRLRQGFRKEKNGPCCFRYVRDEHRQEMRQVVYVEDGYGNLTEVGHDYVLVPQRTRQPELVPPPPAPIMADIQPPQEYQQPKVVPNTAPQF
ncbi:hypothetical protein SS50377_24803 [Spironucleus salmonicida]|uniref:Uncharacterized protein n=1 Tax=Spironucleus salmonicida TaxID=348837 RepID=V6LY55_9EUKA|nr:hypothetical protein SS50377_24803 [Spironucleus salmonicida]|eukprot:EST49587.1 Hypothetical protein SS50377_10055 [Spironucleus salmonicida]